MQKPPALLLIGCLSACGMLSVCGMLSACGMKGALYEPAPPVEPGATLPPPDPVDTDKGPRKTLPAPPDPARSE